MKAVGTGAFFVVADVFHRTAVAADVEAGDVFFFAGNEQLLAAAFAEPDVDGAHSGLAGKFGTERCLAERPGIGDVCRVAVDGSDNFVSFTVTFVAFIKNSCVLF